MPRIRCGNGASVLSNFDIFKTAGAKNQANVQTFAVNADGNGRIVVEFTSNVNRLRQPARRVQPQ